MSFSERVKTLRKNERYSQNQFSEIIGVRPNTVWRWENNKATPDAETVMKIAKALGTTVAYLLGETNIPQQQNIKQEEYINAVTPKSEEQSFKTDKGMMTYYFNDKEKIEMPAIPELVPAFQAMIAERLKTL